MIETKTKQTQEDHMRCDWCGETLKREEYCYQIRYGYIEEDGITFLPDADIAYRCVGCGVETGNYS